MPTFKAEDGTGSTYAVFLFTVPNVDWFKKSLLAALAEMLEPNNWILRGDVDRETVLELANTMYGDFQLTTFNPFPVGMIFPYGGTVSPDGYLLCDGGVYGTADYPELFSKIGYEWGGSGSDFNVPDLINNVPVGAGGDFAFGSSGGQQEVTLITAEMPSHSHSDIGHSHSIPLVVGLPAQAGVGFSANQTVPILTASTGISFANIQNTGGDGAHDNMPPYKAMNYIIYAGR